MEEEISEDFSTFNVGNNHNEGKEEVEGKDNPAYDLQNEAEAIIVYSSNSDFAHLEKQNEKKEKNRNSNPTSPYEDSQLSYVNGYTKDVISSQQTDKSDSVWSIDLLSTKKKENKKGFCCSFIMCFLVIGIGIGIGLVVSLVLTKDDDNANDDANKIPQEQDYRLYTYELKVKAVINETFDSKLRNPGSPEQLNFSREFCSKVKQLDYDDMECLIEDFNAGSTIVDFSIKFTQSKIDNLKLTTEVETKLRKVLSNDYEIESVEADIVNSYLVSTLKPTLNPIISTQKTIITDSTKLILHIENKLSAGFKNINETFELMVEKGKTLLDIMTQVSKSNNFQSDITYSCEFGAFIQGLFGLKGKGNLYWRILKLENNTECSMPIGASFYQIENDDRIILRYTNYSDNSEPFLKSCIIDGVPKIFYDHNSISPLNISLKIVNDSSVSLEYSLDDESLFVDRMVSVWKNDQNKLKFDSSFEDNQIIIKSLTANTTYTFKFDFTNDKKYGYTRCVTFQTLPHSDKDDTKMILRIENKLSGFKNLNETFETTVERGNTLLDVMTQVSKSKKFQFDTTYFCEFGASVQGLFGLKGNGNLYWRILKLENNTECSMPIGASFYRVQKDDRIIFRYTNYSESSEPSLKSCLIDGVPKLFYDHNSISPLNISIEAVNDSSVSLQFSLDDESSYADRMVSLWKNDQNRLFDSSFKNNRILIKNLTPSTTYTFKFEFTNLKQYGYTKCLTIQTLPDPRKTTIRYTIESSLPLNSFNHSIDHITEIGTTFYEIMDKVRAANGQFRFQEKSSCDKGIFIDNFAGISEEPNFYWAFFRNDSGTVCLMPIGVSTYKIVANDNLILRYVNSSAKFENTCMIAGVSSDHLHSDNLNLTTISISNNSAIIQYEFLQSNVSTAQDFIGNELKLWSDEKENELSFENYFTNTTTRQFHITKLTPNSTYTFKVNFYNQFQYGPSKCTTLTTTAT